MDDLIAEIIRILTSDSQMQGYFPGSQVIAVAPKQSESVAYPRIVVTGKEGASFPQGEPGEKFTTGRLVLATYVQEPGFAGLTADSLMWAIANRSGVLVGGDVSQGLTGILGVRLTDVNNAPSHRVTRCRQIEPTGPGVNPDGKTKLHVRTYSVQILR